MKRRGISGPVTWLLLLASLGLVQAAGAQAWRGAGRAKGVVVDPEGKPVAGATVVATWTEGTAGEGPAPMKTDAKGRWSLIGLVPGDWKLAVEAAGFQPFSSDFAVYPQGSSDTLRAVLVAIPKEVLEAEREATRLETVNAALAEGNRLATAGEFAAARTAYGKVLELVEGAKRAEVLTGIASTWVQEHKPDEGVKQLEQALAVDPNNVPALKLMVSVLASMGRDQEAKQYLARIPDEGSLDPSTQINLGIMRYNEGKLDEASAIFERVVAQNPDRAEAYYFAGLVHLNQEHNQLALERFEKFLELAPQDQHAAEAREFVVQLEKMVAAKP